MWPGGQIPGVRKGRRPWAGTGYHPWRRPGRKMGGFAETPPGTRLLVLLAGRIVV